MNPQIFTSRLIKKQQVSRDAYSFYFARPQDFEFLPGQYIKMTLSIPNPDERGISRFFSIASSPTERQHLMITTRILESTFKKTLASLPIDSGVQMRGPYGAFVLDEEDVRPKVFLTGGIGITPFRSMSIYAHDRVLKIPILLMASFSTPQDLVFYDELSKISDEYFKFVVTITHTEDSTWRGEIGRIDSEKTKKYIENVQGSAYYIAGPETMVTAMAELVKQLGVSDDQVKKENFPGY